MNSRTLTAALVALAITVPAGAAFVDVSAATGILVDHVIADICPPVITSGAAWADYDNDGDADLFLTNHGGADHLFRNDGDGSGDGIPEFVDVAPALGLADESVGLGTVWIDVDNDGDQDLFVLRWGGNALYRNDLVETGSVGFTEAPGANGLADTGRGITAGWADYDGDGDLDVYIAKHGECNDFFDNNFDRLFRNDDLHFVDVTTELLCDGCFAIQEGLGFAPGWFDYDNDGDPDLYVVNDDIADEHSGNVLWRNDGPDGMGGWSFTDVTTESGTGAKINAMGLGIGDANNDGWMDLAFSNIGKNFLLINRGDGSFSDVSAPAGIERAELPSGDPSITWGTVFLDYDLDRDLDLFLVAGYIAIPPFEQPNAFFRNEADGTFTDISAASGLADTGRGRSAATADFDQDGFVDVVVGRYGEPPIVYHNDEGLTSNNHYLAVTVEGVHGNRDGIGTRLYLRTADGLRQMRAINTGSTHGGGDYRQAVFGLGSFTEGDLVVRWPDGQVRSRTAVPADQHLHLVEPSFRLEITGAPQSGAMNELVVTGAEPGANLALVRARQPGRIAVPGCDFEINLGSPGLAGQAVADGSGGATFTTFFPQGAAGRVGYFQVVDRGNCSATNRLVLEIQ